MMGLRRERRIVIELSNEMGMRYGRACLMRLVDIRVMERV